MREKVVKREELFIISKVWNDMHDKVHIACRQSLKDLRLDYLDLYLVHWPFRNYHAPGCDVNYRNPDAKPFSVDEYMETWRQCEELVEKGLVRYIGMSNMTIPKLEAVLPLCRIKPAVLEMELHPSFQQPELFDYAVSHNMLPIGYCPLGSPSRPERIVRKTMWWIWNCLPLLMRQGRMECILRRSALNGRFREDKCQYLFR